MSNLTINIDGVMFKGARGQEKLLAILDDVQELADQVEPRKCDFAFNGCGFIDLNFDDPEFRMNPTRRAFREWVYSVKTGGIRNWWNNNKMV